MIGSEQKLLVDEIKDKGSILQCAKTREKQGAYILRFTFGNAAPYVRWISLYFLPHNSFSFLKIGSYKIDGESELAHEGRHDIAITVEPPGVLRARVYYDGLGLWEYSREIF